LSTINRKHYSPEEKVVILKKHLLDQVPISTICDEYHLQPTVFYRWQKEFFENGAAAFQRQVRPQRGDRQSQRIEELETKLSWFSLKWNLSPFELASYTFPHS
jgi:transposase-like protein